MEPFVPWRKPTNAKADNLIHPIRLRILLAIATRQLSTQQIAAFLPDVPPATLYRHIRAMVKAGIMRLVEERPMRGATERIYAIALEQTQLTPEEYQALTPGEHERMFTTFTAMLLSQFHNYVHQENFDLFKDGVSYRTAPLYLSEAEFAEMMQELSAVVRARLENPPSEERKRRLFSFVTMPDVHSD